jgi:hypothetical protein
MTRILQNGYESICFTAGLCLLSLTAPGQSYTSLISGAESLYRTGAFSSSLKTYRKAFAIREDNPTDLYNAGCTAALDGRSGEALEMLHLSIKYGWMDLNQLQGDKDLISLHALSEWRNLVAALRAKIDRVEQNYNRPLQAELLAIFDDDQKTRQILVDSLLKYGSAVLRRGDPLVRAISFKDSINLSKIDSIIARYGWVGTDVVGQRASQAIFLVIQHSTDLQKQEKFLLLMREAVREGNASAADLALLEDRVALAEGKKQIYGTQIGIDKDGGNCLMPLEDPDHVDERRRKAGLGPLADYLKQWNIPWDGTASKPPSEN